MPESLAQAYERHISDASLSPDPAQAEAVVLLSKISDDLSVAKRGGLRRWLGKEQSVQGAYIWGEVGRGKTLLMDLFFSHVPTDSKRRVHFHAFMDEVHLAIAAFRAEAEGDGARDPIPAAAKQVIGSTQLLCLDEFHVHDIANAMLLQRLFAYLFEKGVVLVATSNVAPNDLYRDGLNRSLFMPFISLLKEHARVHELRAAQDYRQLKFKGEDVFHIGVGAGARRAMDAMWSQFAAGEQGTKGHVKSLGREIEVPCQALGAARFGFSQLCEQPLGARDFVRIGLAFNAMVIDDIPQFSRDNSNAAKRFILLIDTLYDRGVKLAASFAVPIADLGGDKDTAFEFVRCVSRLVEMQSDVYLAAAPKAVAAE